MPPLIGGHAPVAAGLGRASIAYTAATGAEALQVFVSNPRGWAHAAGDPGQDAVLREHAERAEGAGLPVFVHAPYLVNVASPDPRTRANSLGAVRHALRRGAQIGAAGVVVHAGSAVGGDRADALRRAAAGLLPLIDEIADDGPDLLIEPMAGQGQMLCSRVGELGPYLDALDRHPRVGVCLDTAHVFAAGHDLSAPGGVGAMLDALVNAAGPGRLRLVHANDSASPAGSLLDRHASVGGGLIGLEPFGILLGHPLLAGVPLIVETPGGKDGYRHADDIALLKKLRDA